MLPVLQVGPLALQLPGLLLLLGLWLGLNLAERHAPRTGVQPAHLYNLTLVLLLGGLIGARLAYVLRYTQAFAADWSGVFSLSPSLLDPWGGAAVGGLAAAVYGQRRDMRLWPTLDALTPLLAVFAIAQAAAHLAAGTAFGAPASLPWAIELWGAMRHPSQVYTLLAAGLILGLLWPSRATLQSWPPGVYFLVFIASSAAAALFLGAFRGDSRACWGGLRCEQIFAWLALAGALWGLRRLFTSPAPAGTSLERDPGREGD